MTADVIEQPLQHQQYLRPAGYVGMDGKREYRVIHFPIDPVELIAPHFLEVSWIDEAVGVRRLLDEHHRRQVVQIPASRYFDQVRLHAALQRLHPFPRFFGIIDQRPAVADAHVVRLEILVHQAMVVFDASFQQQFVGDRAELPPRRDVAGRATARYLGHEVDTFVQDLLFLLAGHRDRIFMGVAVNANFVTRLHYHGSLFRESFDRMPGDEPGGLDAEALEQVDQTRHADFAGEQSARNIVRRIFSAIGPEPAGDRIHVYTESAQNLFGHLFLLELLGACTRLRTTNVCSPASG